MFERDDRIYYERRARQATELGDGATDPKIAELHYELALRFSILAVQRSPVRADVVALRKVQKSAPPELAPAGSDDSVEPELERVLKQG